MVGGVPDGKILHVGVAHSLTHAGGCEGITEIWLDDTRLPLAVTSNFTGDPNTGEASIANTKYNIGGVATVKVQSYRGTGTQSADTTLVGDGLEASTAYRRGIQWSRFTLTRANAADDEAFQKAFPRGVPTLAVTSRGIRCYDPRNDSTNGGSGTQRYSDNLTWTFTRNPALIASTYRIMNVDDGGMGTPPTSIDWASVIAAANICDEPIVIGSGTYDRFADGSVIAVIGAHSYRPGDYITLDYTSGGATDGTYVISSVGTTSVVVQDANTGITSGNVNVTEPRVCCDIVLSTQDSLEVNLRYLLDTMMGECIPVDGLYKFYAGAYRTPTFTLDESWLRSNDTTVQPLRPIQQVFNAVRVLHDDKFQNFQHVEAPGFTNATYEAQDNNDRLWREEVLEGVSSTFQAQRAANIYGLLSRAQRTIAIPCNFKALDVECWENGYVNLSEFGLSNAVHKVIDWTWDGVGPVLIVQQDDSSYYAGATYSQPISTVAPASTAEKPPQPTGLTATGVVDGVDLAWAAPQPSQIKQIDIYRATVSGGPYTLIKSAVGYSYHDPITTPGTYYYVIRSRNYTGDQSVDSAEVSAFATRASDSSAQLGSNLDFENGNTGWQADSGRWAAVQDANARSGGWCARFTSTGSSTTDTFRNTKRAPVSPGDLVLIYGYAKSTAGADGSVYWRIEWRDAAGVELSTSDGSHITPTTTYTQSRISAVAPANAAYATIELVGLSISTGTWYADDGYVTITPKSIDEIPDGSTYGRTVQTALTSGQPDLSKAGVVNKTLDYVSDTATYARIQTGDTTGNRLDFSKALLNKHLDNIPDGTTYGRPVLTALTSGQPDLSKAGVINKTLDYIGDTATYGRVFQDTLTSGRPDLSKSVQNKTLDYIADTASYARPLASRINAGRPVIDFSEAIHSNKNLDNVADGAATGGRRAQRVHPFVDNGGSAAWIKLGTWVGGAQARGFVLRIFNGVGYNSAGNQQSCTEIIVRGSNGGAAPNLSGIVYFTRGTTAVTDVKATATGGSTSATNLSWDIYVSVSAFAKGTYTVDMAVDDSWTHSGTVSADPGAASSTVVTSYGDVMADYQGRQDWSRAKVINKTLDSIADTATYGRVVVGALTSGQPDLSKSGVINKTLDQIADTATYARPLASRISSGKPLIDFSEAIHLNKNVDNVGDGTTYARTVATALTSGQPDLSKSGVINKTLDQIADTATYGRVVIGALTSGQPDLSKSGIVNKTLDYVSDTATYARVIAGALTSGQPDLSLSGVINKTLDQIADTASYARPTAAAVSSSNLGGVTGYGKFYQYIDVISTGSSGNQTIPYGASLLTIRGWGGGSSGSKGTGLGTSTQAGGGAGAFKKSVLIQNADWNQTIAWTRGAGGASQTTSGASGNSGGTTTVTSSGRTFTNLNLSATGGSNTGSAGSASGGDTNVSGTAGAFNSAGPSAGGNSGTIDSVFGPGGLTSESPGDGRNPGGGGKGTPNANSGKGGEGVIMFIWS